MKQLIRKLAWKVLGTPPSLATPHWRRPIDTLNARREILDMAIMNIAIGTRNEETAAKSPTDDTLLGDYLEFGVFQGGAFIHSFKRAAERIPTMRFFAFDSFEGLPELKGRDEQGEFHEGQFACSEPDFRRRLAAADVDERRVVTVPGWFDKSLTDEVKTNHQLHVASIAFIDCDLYESCVPVMEFLTSLVRQGSILIFDDWHNFRGDASRGVQLATQEWLDANPSFSLTPWFDFSHHGKAFIVNVKSN
ncbi:MAG: TylF/MycF/NovP-related O-methyltransferase [Planctomycetota bacterium]